MSEIIKKKKRKFFIVLVAVVFSITILLLLFCGIDYLRALNGKKPIFVYHTVNVQSFDVEMPGFEESAIESYPSSASYYGFGYNVTTCDEGTNKYYFKLGNKSSKSCYEALSCVKEISEDDTNTTDYTFIAEQLIKVDKSILIPIKQVKNAKTYEKEFMKIGDLPGCDSTFNKVDDVYALYQSCNLSKMSADDIKSVFSFDKESLPKTREEVINSYADDSKMKCQ